MPRPRLSRIFVSGFLGLYDQNFDFLSLVPPCMQCCKTVKWPGYLSNNFNMKLVSQNRLLRGFSTVTATPNPMRKQDEIDHG